MRRSLRNLWKTGRIDANDGDDNDRSLPGRHRRRECTKYAIPNIRPPEYLPARELTNCN